MIKLYHDMSFSHIAQAYAVYIKLWGRCCCCSFITEKAIDKSGPHCRAYKPCGSTTLFVTAAYLMCLDPYYSHHFQWLNCAMYYWVVLPWVVDRYGRLCIFIFVEILFNSRQQSINPKPCQKNSSVAVSGVQSCRPIILFHPITVIGWPTCLATCVPPACMGIGHDRSIPQGW